MMANWVNLIQYLYKLNKSRNIVQTMEAKPFSESKNINSFSDNDIREMNFIETGLEEAKKILSKAKPLANKTYLWKGYHFAMATFANGQKRRIQISVYGGFFKDLTGKKYYEFKDEAREDWDKFWTENYASLLK